MQSRINITPNSCHFIVNKNKRKIICIIEHTKFNFLDIIYETKWDYYLMNKNIEKFYMPNRFVGIATCHIEDDWDEELGKRIAFSKLKDKYNASFYKRASAFLSSISEDFNNLIDFLNIIGAKFSNSTKHRHAIIDNLLKEKFDNDEK